MRVKHKPCRVDPSAFAGSEGYRAEADTQKLPFRDASNCQRTLDLKFDSGSRTAVASPRDASYLPSQDQLATLNRLFPHRAIKRVTIKETAQAWQAEHPILKAQFGSVSNFAAIMGLNLNSMLKAILRCRIGGYLPSKNQLTTLDRLFPRRALNKPNNVEVAKIWRAEYPTLKAQFGSVSKFAVALGLNPGSVNTAVAMSPSSSYLPTKQQVATLNRLFPGRATVRPNAAEAARMWRAEHPTLKAQFGSIPNFAVALGLNPVSVHANSVKFPSSSYRSAEDQLAALDRLFPGQAAGRPNTVEAARMWRAEHPTLKVLFGSISNFAEALGLNHSSVKAAVARHPNSSYQPTEKQLATLDRLFPDRAASKPNAAKAARMWRAKHPTVKAQFGSISKFAVALGLPPLSVHVAITTAPKDIYFPSEKQLATLSQPGDP